MKPCHLFFVSAFLALAVHAEDLIPTAAVDSIPPTHTFIQVRSQIKGGAPKEIVNDGVDASESDKYESKLYKTIGTYWYINVEKNMPLIGVGEVRFKFYVRANGMIDQITTISSSGQADVLKAVSLRAIREGLPLEPFSDNMKKERGDGYWEEIVFAIR
ncbi:hypothetical protein [Verrucomicrobium sp. GAS474]|uniref:hypothetical protein n=1 Tax=Verrucomicrobium sp. GAS474 TaxID=1882831 RepID=UPI0012FFB30E|nr:hypothetical protein [Verrucomicrobium sp. GAS474]